MFDDKIHLYLQENYKNLREDTRNLYIWLLELENLKGALLR